MSDENTLREYLRRAVADLQGTRRELHDLRSRATEPIAIVSAGCRFPGDVRSAGDLWDLVRSGGDAISPFPENRGWDVGELHDPARPGIPCARRGGFLHDAGAFDPAFFGISPREALAMDPQQRLLLEVAWETFEDAGVDPRGLRGSRTGVFVGAMHSGYDTGAVGRDEEVAGLITGNTLSVASGRISFVYGLEGPAVTVDTACSSSLVALHLAVRSLRAGECGLALAGGVTVMATPATFVEFARQGGLSPDARCKAFSDSADGTAFSEGAGLVLLERLSDARRHGHPVLGLVRGTAVNQDGASNGLTAPNGPSQERVIRAALVDAGLSPGDVDVVEAHGTGTVLGDPIEAQAILATYGQDRDRPLLLGSVKSNIGHTQAAAGLAGVLKMVYAMRRGEVPATLHAGVRSPHVDWSAGSVELATEPVPWPATGRPGRAAVSSFGVSGTNAHVVLEAAPDDAGDAPAAAPENPWPGAPWLLSAKTPEGLREQARRLADRMRAEASLRPVDVAYSLCTGRAVLPCRAAGVATDRDRLLSDLDGVAAGAVPAGVTECAGADGPAEVVFAFAGQGAQWDGMAAALLESSPVFAASIRRCADALAEYVDWSLEDVLRCVPGAPAMDRTDVIQHALWAVRVSLAELWRSCGVEPAAVVGHSQGEIAAACVAGALSIEDGARVVALRNRALLALTGAGAMASVALPVAAVEEQLSGLGGDVSLAAVNGPGSVVVSGRPDVLATLVAGWSAAGVRTRMLPVDYASHSAMIERIEVEILESLASITPRPSRIPLFSTVTGDVIDTATMDARYWYRNLRETVRFEAATRTMLAAGYGVFLEVGPHPDLRTGLEATIADAGSAARVSGTLRRDDGGADRMLAALAEAASNGAAVDWPRFFAGSGARAVTLPTYAFQRREFWLGSGGPAAAGSDETGDSEFWAAVETGDSDRFATLLGDAVNGTRPALTQVLPVLADWRRRRAEQATVDDWSYRVSWASLPAGGGAAPRGRWLAVLPERPPSWAGPLLDGLAAKGLLVEPLPAGGSLAEALAGDPVTGVLSLLATEDGAAVDGAAPTAAETPGAVADDGITGSGPVGLLELLRVVERAGSDARVWCVTRGAVAIDRTDRISDPGQAQLWGFGRVAALERPDRWGGLVDLPARVDVRAAARVADVLAGTEDQVAVRGAGLFGRRLVRAAPVEEPEWTPPGTVLVTGGTGALGARVARWLAAAGTGHLVLTSRRGPDAAGAAELVRELTELGARASVVACDAADRGQLSQLLAGLPDLSGVVHAAGVLDDGVMEALTPERFDTVLRPKVTAAALLDELTREHPLSMFVLFSSITGVIGNAGQANYAAANAYLDALAERRRADGLPATAVAWGAWGESGLAADEGVLTRLRREGLRPMGPDAALRALRRAVATGDVHRLVADIDWARYGASITAVRPSPLLGDLPEVRALASEESTAGTGTLVRALRELGPAEQVRHLVQVVRAEAARGLGHGSPEQIDPTLAFAQLGFDSLTAVELRNRLVAVTALRLPATLLFDHPTVADVAAFLHAELAGSLPAAPARTEARAASGREETGEREPIAIVGMACRYPGGACSPEELWELVLDGRDVTSPLPDDRGWDLGRLYHPDPANPGTTYARGGGFLPDLAAFDAGFFGISPREALAMDPQQRMLLETSWEAFERAGIDPHTLHGTDTGVFIGEISQEYLAVLRTHAMAEVAGHLMTGNAASVTSGRIAYTYGLHGPAVTIDTACSSSLVALHLAVRSLRSGESNLALAGGATLMPITEPFVEFSRQRGLSPDGRCKAFAAEADGMAFAEGVGVLLVERLSDARANGHPVLALVRGSAINSDGASNGLTAPNGPAQRRVIEAALADARLTAADVDVIEAHGTGTPLGDPIEAQALLATYGARPADRPALLGSVKTNIGHTQAAAGAAGVQKMVQALRTGTVPRSLHAENLSTHVDWSAGALSVVRERTPWPAVDRPRRAAVSSFGVSGTNAHVILEAAPDPEPAGPDTADGEPVPWVLSAATPPALREQAARLAAFVRADSGTAGVAELAHALNTGRAALPRRASGIAADTAGLLAGLDALAAQDAPGEDAAPGAGDVVFTFPGQGSQWDGMAAALLESSPVFADSMAECAEALSRHVDWSLFDVLGGAPDAPSTDRVDVVQPVLWAVMVSLARLWRSRGVEPAAVVGHSQGEIAAACVAGVLSVDDAALVVALRSRALRSLAGSGGMLSVGLPADVVRERLSGTSGAVSLAVVNGPESAVVSGPPRALAELAARWQAEGVRARTLPVDYASHSPQVELIEAELLELLAPITPRPARIPLVSTVTGGPVDTTTMDAGYWYRNLRDTVEFERATRSLLAAGHRVFLEVSPHPVLLGGLEETIAATGIAARATGTLRRDDGGPDRFATALGAAFGAGARIDWAAGAVTRAANRTLFSRLPTYPFQRSRFWPDPAAAITDVGSAGLAAPGHPLLGATVELAAGDGVVLTARWSLTSHPWLGEHVVRGTTVVPGTALVEVVVRAGDEVGRGRIAELTLHEPMILVPGRDTRVQIEIGAPDEAGMRPVGVHSQLCADDEPDAPWSLHATGTLTEPEPVPTAGDAPWPPPGAEPVDLTGFYELAQERGYGFGPAFRGLRAAWRRGREIHAEVALPEAAGSAGRYGVHPALLDAALHAARLDPGRDHTRTVAPFEWTGVDVHATGATELRVRIVPAGEDTIALSLTDPGGGPVMEIAGLSLRELDPAALLPGARSVRDSLLHLEFPEAPAPATRRIPVGDWAVLGTVPGPLAELGVRALAEFPPDAAPRVLVLPAGNPADADPLDALEGALSALHTVLEDEGERFADTRLVVLTTLATGTGPGDPGADLAGAAVGGLVRSAQNEYPDRIALVDVDDDPASWRTVLATQGAEQAGEPHLVVRRGAVHVPRLVRTRSGGPLPVSDPARPWRLTIPRQGSVDDLELTGCPEVDEPLAAGQVRLDVRAAGVNFRDVLTTLGMYPGGQAVLGVEAAGVVTGTGPGVTGLRLGDRVMGLVTGGFGPVAVADEQLLAPIPPGWTFAQAATAPVAFVTAYYGLRDLGGLEAGQSVLIHTAAGGVGMAATQLARHWGADLFGTASAGKQPGLVEDGWPADRLASSRDTAFGALFRNRTGGRGVDLVLHSLAGAFTDASLELLAPGGRLIDMSKTDVRDPDDVWRERGVHYRGFETTEAGVERIAEILAELGRLFADGTLRPLPTTAWDLRHAREAFRFVAQARHVGKVVLVPPPRWNPDGTVLITGGTGLLGGLLARHLVATRDVRHLVLVSRGGPAAPGCVERVAELTELGADVRVVACDVADRDAVRDLLATVPPEHPLTAVVHAAGVTDDGMLRALTPERLRTVVRAKVDAARHLADLTEDTDLAELVLFSAGAGVLGNPGQANYAAANSWLDAFARARRAAGRPTTAIAWGLWEQASALTGDLSDADVARIRGAGITPLSATDGLALFDAALTAGRPALLAAALDTSVLRTDDPAAVPALLRALHRPPPPRRSLRAAGSRAGDTGIAARLAGLPVAERLPFLTDLVVGLATTVLGHTGSEPVHVRRAFRELGFDSLTAVELRNRLTAATGLRLPASLVFDHPTAAELAEFLVGELGGAAPVARAVPVPVGTVGDEPIAIVGMACRLPGGVTSPDEFWELLAAGRDAIGDFPTDRGWDLDGLRTAVAGATEPRQGGFLHDIADFDADFFGISPREAVAMDPQQRLLLETAWQTFEQAGIDPRSVRGTPIGVFAGLFPNDYVGRAGKIPDDLVDYVSNGNAVSATSGRIAYNLGLEGPAVTVDTACSSSLVALHLAIRSLRAGDCSLALAGGVTVMSSPTVIVDFARQGGLAPDGRCKAFSGGADGTGFGEGAGLVLVERLSDALAAGHEVLAVVRGSAMNSDGASNGFTAPSGPAQQRVIRAALADAGLSTRDVDVVEAHGTGTWLGDPIEAQALLATYGRDRDVPLLLGSVKSNIGHTQAASGVAGVIKAVLALRHGTVPASLHVDRLSTQVDWDTGAVEVVSAAVEWPAVDRPRRAAVSSFGITGTNAHVVLEQAPAPAPAPEPAEHAGPVPLLLSARGPDALRGQAAALLTGAVTDDSAVDVAFSLATRRAVLEYRAVVVGDGATELHDGLRALAGNGASPGLVTGGYTADRDRRVVFVFPGQGSQWLAMGAGLMAGSPVFAARIADCERALDPHVDWSLRAVLSDEPDAPPLDRVDVAQPAIWAMMVSLAALWQAHGVRPAAVVGHSQGEIAAACVAGALSLDDAARVVAVRSKVIAAELSGPGGMVSVAAPAAAVGARLEAFGGGLSVAAVNGPGSTVVSGDAAALHRFVAECAADGVRAKTVQVDYASHSAHVERIANTLPAALEGIEPLVPHTPFLSTVTGEWITEAETDAGYWYRNLRRTVLLEPAVRGLLERGHDVFLEVSPHPVLAVGLEDTIAAAGVDAAVLASLQRDDGGPRRWLTALAEAHVRGVAVDWEPVVRGGRSVPLPGYAFQRRRYWLESAAPVGRETTGPVLLSDGGAVHTVRVRPEDPWAGGHRVDGVPVLPAIALLERVIEVGDEVGCPVVRSFTLDTVPTLDDRALDVQIEVRAADGTGNRELVVARRSAGTREWTRFATGVLAPHDVPEVPDLAEWPPVDAVAVDPAVVAERLAGRGIVLTAPFDTLRAAWQRDGEFLAEAGLPDGADASLSALLTAALDHGTGRPGLPVHWSDVVLLATGATALRIRLRDVGDGELALVATDPAGQPVLLAGAVRTAHPGRTRAPDAAAGSLHEVTWPAFRPAERVSPPAAVRTVRDPGELSLPEPGTDVLLLRPDTAGNPVAAARAATAATLAFLRETLADDRSAARMVVCTTHDDPAAGAVRGLVRSAQSEHPGRVLLVDTDGDPASEEALPSAIGSAFAEGETELALRAGEALVPRLAPAVVAAGRDWDLGAEVGGTVLITGGTGALGALVARHLVTRHGVRDLVLAGRAGPAAAGADALRAELAELGARVRIVACDVADRDALAALLADVPAEHPLTAVFHTAGVLDDGLLDTLDEARLERVLRPKVDGAWNLHELCGELSAFVLFSSIAGLTGPVGQANYAAANGFLDALAEHRRAAGLPAVSLAWGLCELPGGLTKDLTDADRARMAASGLLPISAEDCLALLDAVASADDALLVPARLGDSAPGVEVPPSVLRGRFRPARRVAAGAPGAPGADDGIRGRLVGLSPARAEHLLLELVTGHVTAVLGLDRRAIQPDRGFLDLGMSSLTGVQLRNRLGTATGLRLPTTLIFDYATPRELARLLREQLAGDTSGVLPELAEFEDAVSRMESALDDETRQRLLARLTSLQHKLQPAGVGASAAAADLAEAGDDEMFDLIDRELGRT